MAKHLTQFFAAKDDILLIAAWVQSRRQIKYVKSGLFAERQFPVYERVETIPKLGTATSESAIAGDCYLVADSESVIKLREVPQLSGGLFYALDQLQNPRTAAFQAGGFWTKEILLHGRVGTASGNPISVEIYQLFATAIRRRFVRAGAFYVGPSAAEHAHRGCRLTIGAQCPREFDLAINRLPPAEGAQLV